MKMFLPAILLVAASSWGQGKTAISKWPINTPCAFTTLNEENVTNLPVCKYAKPHKPKPSAKLPDVFSQGTGFCHYINGVLTADPGMTCSLGPAVAEPCDGWACTKSAEMTRGIDPKLGEALQQWGHPDHVLQMDMLSQSGGTRSSDPSCSGTGDGVICNTNESALSFELGVHYQGSGVGPEHICDDGCPWENRLDTKEGAAIKLSDSEYSHLKQLRASVVEEEKRLAVKYGAFLFDAKCAAAPVCISMWDQDHYEYHGQFLLVQKAPPPQRVSY